MHAIGFCLTTTWDWYAPLRVWFTSDRIIALATVVYAVVTIVMFFSIRSQAKATHRQADIARDAADAAKQSADALMSSERAWMIGKPNMRKFERAPEPLELFMYVCNFKNIGRTPARIIQTGLALRKTKSLKDIPPEPGYEKGEIFSYNEILIVPRDSFANTTVSQITKQDYLALKPSGIGLAIYAYGFVNYLDVFGNCHETCFCHYYYIPGPLEPQIEGFRLLVDAPPAYNKAT